MIKNKEVVNYFCSYYKTIVTMLRKNIYVKSLLSTFYLRLQKMMYCQILE